MRATFVTPYYLPELKFGGPPRKIHSLATGLVARGHSISVLTFASDDSSSTQLQSIDGVSVRNLRWVGRGLKQMPVSLAPVRATIGSAELVHAFGIYNFLSPTAGRLASRLKTPFVLEPLGMYPPRAANQFAKRVYNRFITGGMMRRAAAVIAASEVEAAELAEFTDPKKIVFRRNGIDLEEFRQLPSGERLRDHWRILPDERVVLYIGRISRIKNLEELVLAFAKANLARTRLVMIGPVSDVVYESQLRKVIDAHHLEQQVTFAGPLYEEDQKAALAVADLFVLSSISESFGNAAAEAVAAGVPVLLTETCGIAAMIHGRAGLAVPLGVEPLAHGLRTMMNPELRREFMRDPEAVKRELSWEEPLRQTEELYQRILGESRK